MITARAYGANGANVMIVMSKSDCKLARPTFQIKQKTIHLDKQ